jgi:hypothetical protein
MKKDEWLTPPEILKALDTFDLDPCAPIKRPWDMARTHLTIKDNGLRHRWHGRVWLNPPYGLETGRWLARLVEHGNGIALIFARTETRDWWQYIWCAADAILFLRTRIAFYHVSGQRANFNGGAPSALIAYGQENVTALRNAGISGALITDWSGSSRPLSDNKKLRDR